MTDFEHEMELDDAARLRWMEKTRNRSLRVLKKLSPEFDENGKWIRRRV